MNEAKSKLSTNTEVKQSGGVLNSDALQMPSYWYARTDAEGAGPTYVVGRGDEEITYPCLFRHEAQAMVDALNRLSRAK